MLYKLKETSEASPSKRKRVVEGKEVGITKGVELLGKPA
jgi:hypothetical protein